MKIFELVFNVFWMVFAPVMLIYWLLQERMLQKQQQESIRIMKEMIRRETDGERRMDEIDRQSDYIDEKSKGEEK